MSNNMMGMLKKAQEMQQALKIAQQELAKTELVGSAGNGAVTVTVKGNHEFVKVSIKPEVVDPKDIAMLEDLLVVACNDAQGKVLKTTTEKMKAATGALDMPGLGF